MTKFVITHLLLIQWRTVSFEGQVTDLNWGCYVLPYPILAEGNNLGEVQSVSYTNDIWKKTILNLLKFKLLGFCIDGLEGLHSLSVINSFNGLLEYWAC